MGMRGCIPVRLRAHQNFMVRCRAGALSRQDTGRGLHTHARTGVKRRPTLPMACVSCAYAGVLVCVHVTKCCGCLISGGAMKHVQIQIVAISSRRVPGGSLAHVRAGAHDGAMARSNCYSQTVQVAGFVSLVGVVDMCTLAPEHGLARTSCHARF